MQLKKAIQLAKDERLDLIESRQTLALLYVRLWIWGKYKYDLQKKASLAKKKQEVVSLKEIQTETRY